MSLASKLILMISIAVWLIGHTAWMFFGREWFEIGQSFVIFGASWVLFRERKCIPTEIFFILGMNQFADELLFNPYLFSWNEYLTVLLLMLPILLQKSYASLISRIISKLQKK